MEVIWQFIKDNAAAVGAAAAVAAVLMSWVTGLFSAVVRTANNLIVHFKAKDKGDKIPRKRTSISLDQISLAKLPTTNPDLFGREDELAVLDAAWADPKINILTFVAFGGVGKTALVNKWLLNMREDDYRRAERVYGWSFYSQGAAEGKQASADEFVAAALKWFGDPNPTEGSPWDKGERLATLINEHRTLLILDGLEPLQHPPGAAGVEGQLNDPTLQSLLRGLARHNSGLCVVTTRVSVEDIQEFIGAGVARRDLDQLSPEDGAALLENLGVKGTPNELREAATEYGGHGLALTLLGRYVATAFNGEIRERDKIPRLAKEPKEGGHAERMMRAYDSWFDGEPEQNILRIIGLFDRPAPGDAIEAVRAEPVIESLTSELVGVSHDEWQFAVQNLRAARLLPKVDPNDPDTLDAHPLVREHFGQQLRERHAQAWREGNNRLYEHYKQAAPDLPDTLDEMAPLFAAVAHGCAAGRHHEALIEVYYPRIQRDGNTNFCFNQLGAIGADTAAVSNFFAELWSRPVDELGPSDKGVVLGWAGFRLLALGRLKEAAEPMQAGLDAEMKRKNWTNAAIAANNLSELYLTIGDLAEAVTYGQQTVKLSDQSDDSFEQLSNRTTLADALHQAGRAAEAEALFLEAEAMQKETQPERPLLCSLGSFRYCALLLDQGKHREVQDRAGQTLEWVTLAGLGLLTVALDHLSLGCAHLAEAQQEGTGDFSKAAEHLDHAVDGLRQAEQQDEIPRGFLARAALHRLKREFGPAQRDLDEAMSIAKRGGMGLFQADAHLEYVRLYRDVKDKHKAREHLATAKEMVGRMGYHRRDKEVEELEEEVKE